MALRNSSIFLTKCDLALSDRTIDKLVSRLRKKLSQVGGNGEYIITQRAKGYLFVSKI
jgi:DNA-binding response OmpR family regulator